MKLIAMRGYSGSGKSTRATEIANDIDGVVVNRDYLRKMMLNAWWTGNKEDEDRVTTAEDAQVRALLKSGVSVVVDATHLAATYLRKWARMASRHGAEFEIVDVHADIADCKQRVYERWSRDMGSDHARYLDPKVVDSQAKRFPVEKWPAIKADAPFVVEPVEPNDNLPPAIIVDIDGTLAHIPEGGRSPYDYARVSDDVVDPIIRDLVNRHHIQGYEVLIVSGRDDACLEATTQWMRVNQVMFSDIFMRPTKAVDIYGGKTPDYVVKYRLFNEYIRGNFDVQLVLDDRDQVVDVWRRLGLKCLQVAPGDF